MGRLRDPRWILIGLFLAIIACVPLSQAGLELHRGQRPQAIELFDRKPTAANLRAYENDLESASWAARLATPWVGLAQFSFLRDGGDKAVLGRRGWLFYKPGVDYLLEQSAGKEDAFPAILAFRDQLAARGIQLLLVPVPGKESIYPEYLTGRFDASDAIVCEPTRDLLTRLSAAGIDVVDLFSVFAEAKRGRSREAHVPLYLEQDTHWSPSGLAVAAQATARRLLELGWVARGSINYQPKPAPVRRIGDVPRMLQLPRIERVTSPERVDCVQVVQPDLGRPYTDEAGADVLVIGDSFLRIFEEDEPGSAGFVAHLAMELRQSLTSLVSDGGGSTLVRQELYRRPGLLANKRVVVWEFAERDIRFGAEGWQLVPLPRALTSP